MNRIRPGRVEPRATQISTPPPPDGVLSFSYRFFARTAKFNTGDCGPRWFDGLIDRLQALSSLRPQEVLSNRSPALRAHPIEFADTTERGGFAHLNPQLQGYQPYQFQLSKETGRVHGFFIDLVFHIVWLDPHHRLYA
jgi:hypothetical protein